MVNINSIIDWAKSNNLEYNIGVNYSSDLYIEKPWNIKEATIKNISFIKENWIPNLSGVVFCKKDFSPKDFDNLIIYSNNPKLDFVKCINEFFTPKNSIIHKGKNVHIGEYCSIGNDGFQYLEDNGVLIKFPHYGDVIIEDDVEIGNNVCIDRGALSHTIIRKGVKIDNLVHIAHNCDIGENTMVVANAMIAGSVKIGKNCWISPSSSIKNQIKIGDNSLIGMGAVVLKDVEPHSVMVGNPAKLLRKQC